MTRDEMLERMSSSELTDWIALRTIQYEEREKQQRADKLNRR